MPHSHANRHVEEVFEHERKSHYSNWYYQEWLRAFNHQVIGSIGLGMSVFAAYLWHLGVASIGDVVMVFSLATSLAQAIKHVSQELQTSGDYIGDIRNALDVLGVPHDITDKLDAYPLGKISGEIRMEHMHFQYPEAPAPIFEDLNVTITAGEHVALVGPSGSGKTTFIQLLRRMYNPQSGTISIDGHDLQEVKQESIHSNIAVVSQEPEIFHRSLLENIRYGKPEATLDEVIHVAKLAHAHEFIETLPYGYDTLVGERGVKLSGGQRQRIAIARAMLKNAPILILDEATSSLDSESEHKIQQALKRLVAGRTVIAIAHRLSTIQRVDRILVFEKGRIIEVGTRAELVKKGGVYAGLWNRQSGGFFSNAEDYPETSAA